MVVPVIAVLTKYEALVDRVKDIVGESKGNMKKEVKLYLDKNVLCPMKKTAHPPAAYVQTHRGWL